MSSMDGFDPAWWIAIAAGVVSAWFFGRWYGARQSQLWADASVTSLVPLGRYPGLSVSHDSTPLKNPMVVKLEWVNYGRTDVALADFESGFLGATVRGAEKLIVVRSQPEDVETRVVASDGSTTLEVLPRLIKRGEAISLTAIAEGDAPRVQLTGRLANTEVFPARSRSFTLSVLRGFAWYLVLIPIALAVYIEVSDSRHTLAETLPIPWIVAGALVAASGVFLLFRTRGHKDPRRAIWRALLPGKHKYGLVPRILLALGLVEIDEPEN